MADEQDKVSQLFAKARLQRQEEQDTEALKSLQEFIKTEKFV